MGANSPDDNGRPNPGEPISLPRTRAGRSAQNALEQNDLKERYRAVTFASFQRFCDDHGFSALPTDSMTVRLWLHSHRETWSKKTMEGYRTRINNTHRRAGLTPPCGAETTIFINNVTAGKPERDRVKALLLEDVADMVSWAEQDAASGEPTEKEWRRLLTNAYALVGVLSGCRHRDLCRIRCDDLVALDVGYRVRVRQSKHRHDGFDFLLPHENPESPCSPQCPCGSVCPVAHLDRWLRLMGKQVGDSQPLFGVFDDGRRRLDREHGTRLLAGRWERMGNSPDGISTRSLRVGAATTAHRSGLRLREIQDEILHHRNIDTSLIYLRGLQERPVTITEWSDATLDG